MKIAIAGAGIMGQLLAWSLINEGYEIDLYDAGSQNCSQIAAGLLTPVAELEKSDRLIFKLGQEALRIHWPDILSELKLEIKQAVYFRDNGSLVLSHPRDRESLRYFIDKIETKSTTAEYQKLNTNKIILLEPEIKKFEEAYFFPHEAHIDSQDFLEKLENYLIKKTGKKLSWHKNVSVKNISPKKLEINNKSIQYDLCLDCRGMGAKSIYPDLQGIRGELLWLYAPEVHIQRPIRFLHPRYALYIVPRPQHNYIIGASEISSEDYSEISVKSTLELLSAAYYVHPGFAEARIIKTQTQCRPTLPDYLPKIKYTDGLVAVNGLYRHGFLIAPTLASEIIKFLRYGFSSLGYPALWEEYSD